jgi:hypothetical protein
LRLPDSFQSDTLVISYLGFLDYKLSIKDHVKNQVFLLRPDILQLEKSIRVTADKLDLARREMPHASYTMDIEEIQRLGSSEISDVFKAIPSVRIEGNDLDGRTIQIRGSNPDEVNVYIDGVLINNLRFDHVADLSMVSTENIEKLEVLKGGNLMLLGQGAFGGVVNITTQKSFEPAYSIKLKGGSFKTRFGHASLNVPLSEKVILGYFGQINFTEPEIEFFPGEKYAVKTLNTHIQSKKQNHHLDANIVLDDGNFNTKAMAYLLDYKKPGWENRYDNYVLAGNYKGDILDLSDLDLSVNFMGIIGSSGANLSVPDTVHPIPQNVLTAAWRNHSPLKTLICNFCQNTFMTSSYLPQSCSRIPFREPYTGGKFMITGWHLQECWLFAIRFLHVKTFHGKHIWGCVMMSWPTDGRILATVLVFSLIFLLHNG